MVLLPPPTTTARARVIDADGVLGPVLRGLYSAVLIASGPVADPDHPGLRAHAAYAKQAIRDKLIEHKQYITEHGVDLPEIRDWTWKGESPCTPSV